MSLHIHVRHIAVPWKEQLFLYREGFFFLFVFGKRVLQFLDTNRILNTTIILILLLNVPYLVFFGYRNTGHSPPNVSRLLMASCSPI